MINSRRPFKIGRTLVRGGLSLRLKPQGVGEIIWVPYNDCSLPPTTSS